MYCVHQYVAMVYVAYYVYSVAKMVYCVIPQYVLCSVLRMHVAKYIH